MITLLAATLIGATAVASVLAATPWVRRRRPSPPSASAPDEAPTVAPPAGPALHDELVSALERPAARPEACRSRRRRASPRRPARHRPRLWG